MEKGSGGRKTRRHRGNNNGGDRDRSNKPTQTLRQLWTEFLQFKNTFDQLRATVARHSRVLQIDDNWHSRVSRWINKEVEVFASGNDYVINEQTKIRLVHPFRGKLLWTDRYNIGVEIDGEEEVFNKGHVVRIRQAKER